MRQDQFQRAFRMLAIILIGELLWLSWLKADTPAKRPRLKMPPPREVHETWEPPRAAVRPIVPTDLPEGETDFVDWSDPVDEEEFSLNRIDGESEEEDAVQEIGVSCSGPLTIVARVDEDALRAPPPPCEVEVLDGDGEPKVDCAVVVLGQDGQAAAMTRTNSAGMARLPSSDASADILIDTFAYLHRENGVRMASGRVRIVVTGGSFEISGVAIVDDLPARPDEIVVELGRSHSPKLLRDAEEKLGRFDWWGSQDKIRLPVDESGRFRKSGFERGWSGYVRLVDVRKPAQVLAVAAVTAPSGSVVLRGQRPKQWQEEEDR